MSQRIFITVAEVSGDQHAAQLIRAFRLLDPQLIIEGIGGPEMAAAGAKIHHETVANAAMGWRGALRAFEVYKLLKWTRAHFDAHRPDMWIGVDSPSMNFHFARLANERNIPTMQYVAPQLWAWAEWRMKKLKRWVDRVACVLPFEEKYFRSFNIKATFVGHPLFDDLPRRRPTGPRTAFPDAPPVIGLLPGSRRSEATANFPHLLDVARKIRVVFPAARFLVPATLATLPVVESLARGFPRLEYEQGAFDEMVPQCDLCITVSGTATLHVASYGVPMLAVYRTNPILYHGVVRWLLKTDTKCLVNLLAEDRSKHIVPEFMPWMGNNEDVALAAIDLLKHPHKLDEQSAQLNALVKQLDKPGASKRVAKLAMGLMDGTLARR